MISAVSEQLPAGAGQEAGAFRSVKGRRERQLFGGIFSESGMRKPMPGGFHVEGIAVREESARRDLRGYCVWEKSGNGSEMLL